MLRNSKLKVLTTIVTHKTELKGIKLQKEEVKPSLFSDDMIIFVENQKE
jgi:hypothetical protein